MTVLLNRSGRSVTPTIGRLFAHFVLNPPHASFAHHSKIIHGMENRVYTIPGARGVKVSIGDVSRENLAKVEEQLGSDNLYSSFCDASDHASVQSWIQATDNKFGRPDGVANVAGSAPKCTSYDSRVMSQDNYDWERIIRINITGTMYPMKEEVKHMPNGGSIANVAS
ncbi:NAD(P)-binding protein [Aspergillus novofumigatus IBT 16806]|uniref:NAD(P)-binding protein n=1 Tax=Aspergillus novofumigatus (strain IBT 16806) TaxID=1392255 RepID=A0A2I1CH24_ASPN1|nr:NAD(P)-binding protein [Aspergillus novofumigatus IBT 16806]PKX96917.1 NAD(P)-binding protein [Aspergillus novofumigatus IBT 16806]